MYSSSSKVFVAVLTLHFLVGVFCSLDGRQAVQPCTQAAQCHPIGFAAGGVTVPPSLVNCSAGECVCSECFYFDSDSNRCAVDTPCRTYDTDGDTCEDHRRSQRTAFVLSVILSSTGAANFYIARYELAVPQLLVLLVLIIASCTGRLVQQFSGDKIRTENACVFCTAIVSLIIAIVAALIIVSWWIADMIIFIRNTRTDGDDCALREDL